MKSLSMNNILVSTDFSKAASNALNTAITICQQHDSGLMLVHVIDDSRIFFSSERTIIFAPVQQLVEIAMQNLEELASEIASNYNIKVDSRVLTGRAAHEVCRLAVEADMDLIVIAKRGEFNEASLALGDIASQVVRLSTKPVLCVPLGSLFTGFHKILFPVQERAPVITQYKVARFFCDMADPVFVVAGIGKKSTLDFTPSRLIRLTDLLVRIIGKDGLKATKIVNVCDDVPEELVQISHDEKADLICICMSDMTKFARRGTDHAMDVVEKSSCPVLTISGEFMMQLN